MIDYVYVGKTFPDSIESVAEYLTKYKIPRENIMYLKREEYRSGNGIKTQDYSLLYIADKDNPGVLG